KGTPRSLVPRRYRQQRQSSLRQSVGRVSPRVRRSRGKAAGSGFWPFSRTRQTGNAGMSLRLFRRSAAQLRLRAPRRRGLPRPRLGPLLDRIDIHLEVPAVKYRALADQILKIARTIADLEGAADLQPKHVSEAIQYRSLDRRG